MAHAKGKRTNDVKMITKMAKVQATDAIGYAYQFRR